jgi:hypothetical protein
MTRSILRFWPLAYLVLATALLFAGFSNWAYDDPFITFRYARNIGDGLGMVYNPGVRTLSTTTPLYALLLSGLQFLWPDLPALANLLGALSLAAGGFLIWDLADRQGQPLAGFAALLLYPTYALLVSTLGSETPLYLALGLGAMALYQRGKFTAMGAVLGAAVLVRGDGLLVAGIIGLDWLVRTWRETRSLPEVLRLVPWRAVVVFAGLVLPWVVFGTLYFGSPLPVTLASKQAQGIMVISEGFASGLWNLALALRAYPHMVVEALLLIIGVVVVILRVPSWWMLPGWALLYGLAYAALGVTRYFWYYAPLVPGIVAAFSLGISGLLVALVGWKPGRKTVIQGAGVLAVFVRFGVQVSDLARLRTERDARYPAYRAVGEWLAANTPEASTVGALEVGMIGYFSNRPMVDFAGLIQPEVARQIQPETRYQDLAFYAVEAYQPDYLVLHDGLFRRLERQYTAEHCLEAAIFSGREYAYAHDLVIYDCR